MIAPTEYPEWLQAAAAVLAIIVTPTVGAIYLKYLHRIQAITMPINPREGGTSLVWDITFINRSPVFGGFTVFLFPSSSGNLVSDFRQLSMNDGGMHIQPNLADGALEITVTRFARQRQLRFRVKFTRPDIPAFNSAELRIRIRRKLIETKGETIQVSLALTYQRMMLLLLVFTGVAIAIMSAILIGVIHA